MLLADLLKPVHFRGKARLLHSLCPHTGTRTARIGRLIMETDLSDWIQRNIYLGTFEPAETAAVRHYLQRGMTFVDVGANVGYYTLLAAGLVGEAGRVLAFEPDAVSFARLQRSVQRNALRHVEAIQAGLSDCASTMTLYGDPDSHNRTPTMVAHDAVKLADVPVVRLDDELSSRNVDTVDLLKIDVEGFEPNVLRGAASYLQQGRIRAILCEFNEHWLSRNQSSPAALFDFIESYGFRVTRGALRQPLDNLFFEMPAR